MASKRTLRKFNKEREAHYSLEREKDAQRRQARLKGFRPASIREMTVGVLGLSPGQTKSDLEGERAEALASNMNRAERRARA